MPVVHIKLIPTIEVRVSDDYAGKPYYWNKNFKTAKGAAEFWAFHTAAHRTAIRDSNGMFKTQDEEDDYYESTEKKLIRRSLPIFARLLATS
jgi:hypothetical protein